MSPVESTPPSAKAFVARAKALTTAIIAIATASAAVIVSVVTALKPRDDTAAKATYEEQLKMRREDNEKILEYIRTEFARRDAYLDGRLAGMPQYVIEPGGPRRTARPMIVAPPVQPAPPPKPPEVSKKPELAPAASFDALVK